MTIEYNKDTMNMKTKPFTGRIKDNVSSNLEAVFIEALQKCRAFYVSSLSKIEAAPQYVKASPPWKNSKKSSSRVFVCRLIPQF